MYENPITIDELSERWKVKKSWIYARTRESGPDALPRIKIGKYLRFDPDEVQEWLKKQNDRLR